MIFFSLPTNFLLFFSSLSVERGGDLGVRAHVQLALIQRKLATLSSCPPEFALISSLYSCLSSNFCLFMLMMAVDFMAIDLPHTQWICLVCIPKQFSLSPRQQSQFWFFRNLILRTYFIDYCLRVIRFIIWVPNAWFLSFRILFNKQWGYAFKLARLPTKLSLLFSPIKQSQHWSICLFCVNYRLPLS